MEDMNLLMSLFPLLRRLIQGKKEKEKLASTTETVTKETERTKITLRGESSKRARNKTSTSEMDVLEIQEVFKTSEEDEVTPTFNRYESLEDHELMSDLEEHVLRDQVARNSTTEDEFVPEQDMLCSDSVKIINFKELVAADTTREPAQCNPENVLHDSLLAHNRLLDPAPPLDHLQSISFFSYYRTPRRALWQDLLSIAANEEPWIVGGDFNIVLHIEENQGGSTNILGPMEDFSGMVMESALIEAGFEGDPYTWTNKKIWKRLDRVLYSKEWTDTFNSARVLHLPRRLSDHHPLLIIAKHIDTKVASSFRTKDTLKDWNRQVFGNVFSTVEQAKEATTVAEKAFERDPSDANLIARDKHNAILIQALTTEAKFLKQKSCCKWLEARERNSKYFHALVKKKRIRASINRISVDNLDIYNPEDIKNSTTDFFCNLLSARATPFTEPEFYFSSLIYLWLRYSSNAHFSLTKWICSSETDWRQHLLAQEMIHLLDKRYDKDDIIIFTNSDESNLEKLMDFLEHYEIISGQRINHSKSAFISSTRANVIAQRIKTITGFARKYLPITYLGVPLYKGKKKKFLSNIWKPEHLRGDVFVARLLKLKIPETQNYQKSKIVYWLKPDQGWVKLNTDGASKGNPGLARAGGIVKDYEGKAIFVFSEPIGFTNNMVAEMHVVLRGLGICLEKGFSKV
ncbi:UNVERIFIED_CONTAM: putative ribonuclease H protein [Sesamum calycinum]|uniref:Ribonuclease H protein n=1 Tax=Sesamum calycinum TaxID=2727403 RepID=A0AAW2SGG5_9LAMI